MQRLPQQVPLAPEILRSVVLPPIGGSANPMNLSAWATLLGAALGVGGGIAILAESPSAPALLAVGGTLFLTGPSLSHFVQGELSRGFVQLGLRVAAAAVLAGGIFWGISAGRSPVPWVVAGLGGLALAGLTVYGIFDSELAGRRDQAPLVIAPALVGARHPGPGMVLGLRF